LCILLQYPQSNFLFHKLTSVPFFAPHSYRYEYIYIKWYT
jgi:hypothetical protein